MTFLLQKEPLVDVQRCSAPTWMRIEMLRLLAGRQAQPPSLPAPLPHHFLSRDGFPRAAAGCQHHHPQGSFQLEHPTGHLDSSNQSSLQGHSPALSTTSGAWDSHGTCSNLGWQRQLGSDTSRKEGLFP